MSQQIGGKNYYELLGVSREATSEEIREVYRDLVRVYHPDSNFFSEIVGDKPSSRAAEFFKWLTAAYDCLKNRDSRSAYDRTLPPRLKEWEEGPTILAPQKPRASTSNRFGRVDVAEADEGSSQPETESVAVAQIIRRKRGIFQRMAHIFGAS